MSRSTSASASCWVGCPSFGTKVRAAIKEVWLCPSFGTKIRAAIYQRVLGTAKKLRGASSFFFHFWGMLGGKEDMEARASERSASVAGGLRGVGGKPRSLTAAATMVGRQKQEIEV